SAACTRTSSCRCTAGTRPPTRPSRSPPPRRFSVPARTTRWTWTWSGRASRRLWLAAAQTPLGAEALAVALAEEFDFRKLVAVVGVMADKDAHGILAALESVVTEVVLTANSTPRAMP